MRSFPVAGGRSVTLALFSDVSNSRHVSSPHPSSVTPKSRTAGQGSPLLTMPDECRELLDLMQSGKLEPEAAFLNASLVPDVFPVLAAAHKALLSKSREALTTRTLHSELVYNCSGSKHITESLKRCGIADDTQYILAARFDASDEEMKALEKLISGTEIDLSELETRADQPKILKNTSKSAKYVISGSLVVWLYHHAHDYVDNVPAQMKYGQQRNVPAPCHFASISSTVSCKIYMNILHPKDVVSGLAVSASITWLLLILELGNKI
ncbi:GDP-mannose-dependent alpha-mannosyltransferase [Hordeum vulgare]|nr:GDP-mannose-dependent alpha-mannosyltransferase [Hordeum vulgare]